MYDRDEEYYKQAKSIVKKKKEFRASAVSFALTIPFLAFVNLMTAPEFLWFLFPMFGWGIGLVGAYYNAYIKSKRTAWEDHEIQKEMERMRMQERKYTRKNEERDYLDDRLDLRELRTNYDERDLV